MSMTETDILLKAIEYNGGGISSLLKNETPNIIPGTVTLVSSAFEEEQSNSVVCNVTGKGRLYYAILDDWGDYQRTTFKIAFIIDGKRYVVNSAQYSPASIGYLAKETLVYSSYASGEGVRLYVMGFDQAGGHNRSYIALEGKVSPLYLAEQNENVAAQDVIFMSPTALTFDQSLKVEISVGGGTGQYGNTATLNIMYSLEE